VTDYSRYQALNVEKAQGVATLTLNRPQALNAIGEALHRELEDVFLDLAGDTEVNAVVLTGAGRAFSAGGDVKGMAQRAAAKTFPSWLMTGPRRLIHNMLEVQQPIIAAVNGDAVGLGATVALFCDMVLAANTARIGDPHVRVGLMAGDGGAIIWPMLPSARTTAIARYFSARSKARTVRSMASCTELGASTMLWKSPWPALLVSRL